MNFIWRMIMMALISCSLKAVNALYCYSCQGQVENWKCNENEPVKCQDDENVCVVMRHHPITKRCARDCSSSRGDGQSPRVCNTCSSDFCNYGGPGEEPAPSSSVLQHDAVHEGGTRYVLYAKTLTFWAARATCAQKGGVLANVHSKEIQEFIAESILNNSHAEGIMEVSPSSHQDLFGIWIGLFHSQLNETGNYSWIWTDDGSVISSQSQLCGSSNISYENWEEKPLQNDVLSCGYLSRQGKWKYDSCGKRLSWFLCEYPADGTLKQSIVIKYTVYTYKSRFVRPGSTNLTCDKNMSEVLVTDNLLEKFGFIHGLPANINSGQCGDVVGDTIMRKESSPVCNTTYQFVLCKKPLLSECSLHNDGLKDKESVPPEKDIMSLDSCDPFIYHKEKMKFSFSETQTDQYSASQETCANGRPIAIMWCTQNRTFANFGMIPCEKNLVGALSEIKNASTDEPLDVTLAKIQKLNFLSLQQNGYFSPQHLIHVEEAIKSVLNETKMHGKALPYIVRITSDLQKRISRARSTSRHITNSTEQVNESKKSLVKLLESGAAMVEMSANDSRKDFSAKDVSVEVVSLNEGTLSDGSIAHESKNNEVQIRVFPDVSIIRSKSSGNVKVVFAVYDGDELFPSNNKNLQIDSVVSATVTDGIRTYSVPVEFSFQTTNTNFTQGVCQRRECMYYDESDENWKKNGCRKTAESNDGWGVHTVTCTCDHTTSFAVVVSQLNQNNHALDIASTIGLIACVICLTLTIILFFTTPDLKRIRCGFIHINLCICLDISYLAFLIGIEQTGNRYACLATAAIIHFFLVSSWGWMGVESLTMHRMFVRPLSKKSITETPKVAYGVYMISAAIVLLTLSFSVLAQFQGWGDGKDCTEDYWSSYIADGYCWLQGRSLYFGFLTIAFITLVMNSISAALIIKAITWRKADVPNRADDKPQVHILRALLIAMLLGLAWVFAVPLAVSDDQVVQNVFGWLFAATTSFQGIFIFYFFCIRRKDVRSAWMRCFRNALKPKKQNSTTESAIGLRGARTESFLYLPNTSRNMHSTSEETQKTTT